MMTPLKDTLEAAAPVAEATTTQVSERPKSDTGQLRADAVSLDVPVKVHGSRVTEVIRGITPHTPEWNAEIEETLARQRAAMHPRLYPEIPPGPFICFYPMDRKRGEHKNWYQVPMPERQRQMQDHGEIGRRYAGKVKQIISGSIGMDDWEWGVDLFADDPVVFKKLIYEMRFDEVSAVYALFGTFYVGRRVPTNEIGSLLEV